MNSGEHYLLTPEFRVRQNATQPVRVAETMLQEFALWADVLGGLAVIGGVLFGVVQLHIYRRERGERAAVEVMRSMMSEHFPPAYRLLNHLPDGVTVAEVRNRGPEYEEALFSIGTVFETLGYLVYMRVIPLTVVRELVGGAAIALWRKIGPCFAEVAENEDQGRLVEWYEWLVRRLEEEEARRPLSRASERFTRWRP